MRRVQLTNSSDQPAPVVGAVSGCLAHLAQMATDMEFTGVENLPAQGSCLIVGNHISNYDPVVMGAFLLFNGRFPHWLAKKELFSVPALGWLASVSDQIPVDRSHPDPRLILGTAREQLEHGRTVIMYPEGTITADPLGWPMTGRTGAARLTLSCPVPVIPVGQWGPQDVMGFKKMTFPRFFPRKTMHLSVGEPVRLSDLWYHQDDRTAVTEATERIMTAIDAQVEIVRGEHVPASRYDGRTGLRVPRWATGTATRTDSAVGN